MEYNTSRDKLVMPEYGRHIQKMVDYLRTIEDPEKRQKNAEIVIEIMGALNPHLKIVEDFRHMLWDHLFLIADFDLDIKSPYPIPTKELRERRPDPLPYPVVSRKLRHLGKHIGTVIDKAVVETDEDKRRGFTNTIAYYMKLSYANWHHEPAHDDMIKEELKEISNGKLNYVEGDVKVRVDPKSFSNHNNKRSGKGGYKNGGGRNNNNGNNKNNRNKQKRNA